MKYKVIYCYGVGDKHWGYGSEFVTNMFTDFEVVGLVDPNKTPTHQPDSAIVALSAKSRLSLYF